MRALLIASFIGVFSSVVSAEAPPIPLPSTMPLLDYEREALYPFLFERRYASLPGWKVDSRVRDTGPFIHGQNYGVHPAVRIHYSPDVVRWLNEGRPQAADRQPQDGSFIIKEMFLPPAAIYEEIQRTPFFEANPDRYQDLLAELLTEVPTSGWTVMIKDSGGQSKDGWFWAGPGIENAKGNYDDFEHVRTSGFGLGTCIRCHASAKSQNTFSSIENFAKDREPLQFRVDESWRSQAYLGQIISKLSSSSGIPPDELEALLQRLTLPSQQRSWSDEDVTGVLAYVERHAPADDTVAEDAQRSKADALNPVFAQTFGAPLLAPGKAGPGETARFSFPTEYADHVYPGPTPQHYLTSSNCYGCHGGLGGAPSGLSAFVQTGPSYGEGYNVSPYGEWRWSPMGLAGRDPIFHAQLESELIIMLEENGQLADGQPAKDRPGDQYPVRTVQQALVDTCLRCHGAMGLRQKGLDQQGSILNPHFDTDLFSIRAPLTANEIANPPFVPPAHQPGPHPAKPDYSEYRYGDLAREGVSCTVCHHIAPPDAAAARTWASAHADWLGERDVRVWNDSFFYFLGVNNTGIYERTGADELFGPFADVVSKPMAHAMGIEPVVASKMEGRELPFTRESEMCGTCHTINLPNIGEDPLDPEFPVLTALEPNPVIAALNLPHSIEQATYLEWLNSSFGLGKDNRRGVRFRSCQDCHMPNRFAALDDENLPRPIEPLVSQIASIQDSTYPQVAEQLPYRDITVKPRSDYRRHELVGMNAFLVEMFKQFPEILGVNDKDYETGAKNGAELAIDNMLLSAREGRVASVEIESARVAGEQLVVSVRVANRTGHRFPSGVSFRRVWVEMLVFDAGGNVIWGSGRTNDAGLLIDGQGKPLATELLEGGTVRVGGETFDYQPHYQTIRSEGQVQIYEELVRNAAGRFTTSFVHRVEHVKDNRLPPEGRVTAREFAGQVEGGTLGNQGPLLYEMMKATEPEGAAVEADPDFSSTPSTGADSLEYAIALTDMNGKRPVSVRATVYSQAFMPAWFAQRFSLAREAKTRGYTTPATDRLYYIASRLQLEGTPLEDWKVEIASSGRSPVD